MSPSFIPACRRAPKAPGPDLEWLYDFVAGRGSRPQHGHTTALDRVRADFLECVVPPSGMEDVVECETGGGGWTP